MRMRTQAEAFKAIKEADPHTSLTSHALRKMILSGRIPSVMAGKKYLIDLDALEAHLSTPAQTYPPNVQGIRRIESR